MIAERQMDVAGPPEGIAELGTKLKAVKDDLCDAGRASLHSAKMSAGAARQRAQRYVNDHPVTSLLVAAGAGLMVGSLLRRRHT